MSNDDMSDEELRQTCEALQNKDTNVTAELTQTSKRTFKNPLTDEDMQNRSRRQ